jgi:hypothetical protein
VVGAGDAARRAWFGAATLAAELDEWLSVLVAAAGLVGTPPVDTDAEIEIALSVDTGKLHKRRLWEAWQGTGRCGRWSMLLALGAGIRAHKHPDRLAPYTAPRPLQQRWVVGVHGGYTTEILDPEDNPNAARDTDAEWSIA